MLPLRERHRGANTVITPIQNSSEFQTDCSATRKMQEGLLVVCTRKSPPRRQITALPLPSPSPSSKSLGGLFYFLMTKINITYRANKDGVRGAGAKNKSSTKIFHWLPTTPPRVLVIAILTPAGRAGRPKPRKSANRKSLTEKQSCGRDGRTARLLCSASERQGMKRERGKERKKGYTYKLSGSETSFS